MIVRAHQDRTPGLDAEDRELVDVLAAILVDPNLHTDRIMRLHRDVRIILRAAHEALYREAGRAVDPQPLEARDDHIADLPDLLTAVLTDPNLYTDRRMRLHREIRLVLKRTREF